jgi:hypothetical protein
LRGPRRRGNKRTKNAPRKGKESRKKKEERIKNKNKKITYEIIIF